MKTYYCILIFLFSTQLGSAQVNTEQTDSIKRIRQQDDSMIHASRLATNELMSSHDARGMGRYWLYDFVRISGSGSITIGKDSAVAYWTKIFKEQPTIYYVRTPVDIIISDNGLSAWESGTWTGINTKSKSGNYAAQWVKRDNIWKMQSEYYITLSTY